MNRQPTSNSTVTSDGFSPPNVEARALRQLRLLMLKTFFREVISQAWFRISVVLTLSGLLWAGLYWLSVDVFQFLQAGFLNPSAYAEFVRVFLSFFYAVLMVLLIISSGILMYGSLFRSPEVAFLLAHPIRTERVFLHKFQETILLSSWGFLLLGSPMLLAYGVVGGAPWYYFLMLPAFMLAFVYIPAAIGALLCLALVHWMVSRLWHVLVPTLVLLLTAVVWIAWSLTVGPENDILTGGWFREMIDRLRFAEVRLLPSWWLGTGLLEAADRRWNESLLLLVLILSNALFFRQLAIWAAARMYRSAYSKARGRYHRQRRRSIAWIDRFAMHLAWFLPRPLRLLLVKDLRLFRRDPMQWSQFLVFFTLLGLYFFNVRRFSPPDLNHVSWVHLVSFLNLSVVGLLMSTFTTRFIFPMVSLEGQRLWTLGLLPIHRRTILWGKFLFGVGCSMLPCCGLVLLSDAMLQVPMVVVASHQLTCVILSVGLSGIAVGLGARFPNLRESSPSRIAAGFGGTLALVLSTVYILAVVLLSALPCHLYLAAGQSGHPIGLLAEVADVHRMLTYCLLAGTVGSVGLGFLATVVPLRIGFRAFQQIEV